MPFAIFPLSLSLNHRTLAEGGLVMPHKAKKKDRRDKDRTEPVVLPDVAAEPHPIVTVPEMPVDNDPDGEPTPAVDAPEDAPVGDYVRQIQLEFEEQQEEGKV
jgi:hypothetical protein